MLMMYGDQDPIMPPDLPDDVRRRIDAWSIDCTVTLYGGAGHTFNGHFVDRSGIDSYRRKPIGNRGPRRSCLRKRT